MSSGSQYMAMMTKITRARAAAVNALSMMAIMTMMVFVAANRPGTIVVNLFRYKDKIERQQLLDFVERQKEEDIKKSEEEADRRRLEALRRRRGGSDEEDDTMDYHVSASSARLLGPPVTERHSATRDTLTPFVPPLIPSIVSMQGYQDHGGLIPEDEIGIGGLSKSGWVVSGLCNDDDVLASGPTDLTNDTLERTVANMKQGGYNFYKDPSNGVNTQIQSVAPKASQERPEMIICPTRGTTTGGEFMRKASNTTPKK